MFTLNCQLMSFQMFPFLPFKNQCPSLFFPAPSQSLFLLCCVSSVVSLRAETVSLILVCCSGTLFLAEEQDKNANNNSFIDTESEHYCPIILLSLNIFQVSNNSFPCLPDKLNQFNFIYSFEYTRVLFIQNDNVELYENH